MNCQAVHNCRMLLSIALDLYYLFYQTPKGFWYLKHLFEMLQLGHAVRPSVRPSVCPSVRPSEDYLLRAHRTDLNQTWHAGCPRPGDGFRQKQFLEICQSLIFGEFYKLLNRPIF